ncbi:MAG: hypothetical protein ACXVCY_07305 [Pseudobdellovibrionaceae bacterium]
MSKNKLSQVAENWMNLDLQYATEKEIPEGTHPHLEVYRRHFSEWNAKKLEALTLTENVHSIFQIRSFLFRGRHQEADQIIDKLTHLNMDTKEKGEVLLEKVKLAALEGDWLECLKLSETLVATTLVPVSRMTLFQVEALAFFEVGQFDKALLRIELIESLSSSFPGTTSASYARILRIKIHARRFGTEMAFTQLNHLWEELKASGSLDLNFTQALLRAEIDLCRLALKPHLDRAMAALIISEEMGEKLYIALGLLDCFYASSGVARSAFELRLNEQARNYRRVRELIEQVNGVTENSSSSATAIQIFLNSQTKETQASENEHLEKQGASFVLISRQCILASFERRICIDLKDYPKMLQALVVLGENGELSKEDFFHKIWGTQKYSSSLHGNLIFSLQQRLKRILGVRMISKNSMLSIPNLHFIKP